MPLDFDVGDGADALTRDQLVSALDGTYWVSGWDATPGTNDLEVDIAAGDGAINGGDVSTASTQTVDFTGDPDPGDPRKAVISVDSGGNVVKTLGMPAPADPTNEVRERTWDPQPPAESVPGVVVAEVWLAAGETVLESADVRDRRVGNQAAAGATPNEPSWVEDPNSPQTTTSAGPFTYTLSDTYDEVKVKVKVDGVSNTPFRLALGINSETTDYRFGLADGTESSKTDAIGPLMELLVTNNDIGSTTVEMTGVWGDGYWNIGSAMPATYFGGRTVLSGHNTVATSPLSTIEFYEMDASWNELTVEVYGRNIG